MPKIVAVAENWSIVWQKTLDATTTEAYPREFLPVILTSPIVAISCITMSAYWKNQAVGYINQHINSGLIGAGLARSNAKRILIADELSIMEFPFNVNYQVSIDLFTRVASTLSISVFEYTGPII